MSIEPVKGESAREVLWKAVTWLWAFLGLIAAVTFVLLSDVLLHRWFTYVAAAFLALTVFPPAVRLLRRWRARRAARGSL
jgi:hypothetical protein